MKKIEGKLAFVTGGASGLGLAMTRSFAAAGMRVIAADIEQSGIRNSLALKPVPPS